MVYRQDIEGFDSARCESVLQVAYELKAERFVGLMITRLELLLSDISLKIGIAQRYGRMTWLKSLYEGMVDRENAITLEEARRIGLPNAVKLCTIRETKADNDNTLYHSHRGHACPSARSSELVSGVSTDGNLDKSLENIVTNSDRTVRESICMKFVIQLSLSLDADHVSLPDEECNSPLPKGRLLEYKRHTERKETSLPTRRSLDIVFTHIKVCFCRVSLDAND